jgi:hypothetical protein
MISFSVKAKERGKRLRAGYRLAFNTERGNDRMRVVRGALPPPKLKEVVDARVKPGHDGFSK